MKHRYFYATSTLCAIALWLAVPIAGQTPAAQAKGRTGPANSWTTPRTPDTVLIFQRNLERSCEDRETLVDEIFNDVVEGWIIHRFEIDLRVGGV